MQFWRFDGGGRNYTFSGTKYLCWLFRTLFSCQGSSQAWGGLGSKQGSDGATGGMVQLGYRGGTLMTKHAAPLAGSPWWLQGVWGFLRGERAGMGICLNADPARCLRRKRKLMGLRTGSSLCCLLPLRAWHCAGADRLSTFRWQAELVWWLEMNLAPGCLTRKWPS